MSFTQHIASMTWTLCEPPVSERVIVEHERIFGVTFPGDFREVIQQCPGGHPVERTVFWMDHPEHGRLGSGLGALVTLEPPDDVDGMLWSANTLHHHHGVSCELIPIALDGGGDYMCLDFRESPTHPGIVYWSHEAMPETSLAHLADSFTSFLEMLEPPEEI